jgi:glucose-6-phosphate dehydrogenase assembly protein OpcA
MQTQASANVASAATTTTQGIDVGRIEQELSALWQHASDAVKDGDNGTSVTRACVLNLLVYATEQDDRAEVKKIIDEVVEQNPCRALILIADEDATETSLDAYVSSHCSVMDKGIRQICGEQVTIEAKGAAVKSAPSALVPLLVPDVPVFLWWKDIPHYDDNLFSRLTAMADRLVIDSCSFDHPYFDLVRLAQLIKEDRDFIRVTDLNWGRLTTWRTLIASFWDIPDYRPLLDGLDSILVEYNPTSIAREEITANALLITGWLASQLNWVVSPTGFSEEGEMKRFTLHASDGREIKVEMRAGEYHEGCDGLVSSATLGSLASGAQFYVGLRDDGKKLQTEANIGAEQHTVGRILAYEMRSEGARLSRELSFLGRDKIYEEALASASELIAAMRRWDQRMKKRFTPETAH